MKYPVGPKAVNKAKATRSGSLAAAMGQVLYNATVGEVNIPAISSIKSISKLYVDNKLYFPKRQCYATGIPDHIRIDDHYVDIQKLLREIRDHLEWLSLREVID